MQGKIVVNFSKRFVSGTLKGITYPGHITFPNRESAQSWIDNVLGKEIKEYGTRTKSVILSAHMQ